MDINSYEIFYSIMFYTLSVLLSIGVNVVFFLKARKTKLLTAFMNAQMMVIIWLIAKVLKKSSPNDEIAWLWVVIQYLGVCFFGVTFLDFAYLYKKAKRMPKRLIQVLYIVASVNYLMVFTNDFHHWFFTSVTIFESHYGPWFYVHTAFSYLMILSAYYFLMQALLGSKYDVPIIHAVLFNIGLILPIISNIVYVFGFIKFSYDITPIMYNMTILIFGYSAYRYRFLDIKKVTRSMVIENIHEGIIIIDNSHRIVEYNNIITGVLDHPKQLRQIEMFEEFLELISKKVESYATINEEIKNCLALGDDKFVTEFVMMVHGNRSIFILKLEKIKDHSGDSVGYVFRIIDVTKHKELLQNLEEKNRDLLEINQQLSENISVTKQLAIAKERSRISKEVHDILGHSVTIVISLLEMSKKSLKNDPGLASEKITQAIEIIRGGLIELKKSMKKHANDFIASHTLNDDLNKLIEDFEKSGVNVDYYYKQAEVKLSAETYDTIYRICQESLTNALRHGKASNVTIGVRYVERNIELFIIDDGQGCLGIIKGNGLKGMETRVEALAGVFSCGSPDGEGFNIHVTLPFHG